MGLVDSVLQILNPCRYDEYWGMQSCVPVLPGKLEVKYYLKLVKLSVGPPHLIIPSEARSSSSFGPVHHLS